MYGTWFGTTFIGVLALVALIGLFVLASPLFAVIFVLLALAFLASMIVFRRGLQARARGARGGRVTSGSKTAVGDSAHAGGPPRPRSGGEPVSGEGHASGGETAGQRASARR
ncbi:MAG: hypothetical protein M3P44_03785 [Actinomycetota bacterium]|nr:hypothetical protein [Actinomycetota bacterium]